MFVASLVLSRLMVVLQSWQYCPMYNADRKVVANLHVL